MTALAEAANLDSAFRQAAAGLAGRILLDMETEQHLLELEAGRLDLKTQRPDSSWNLAFKAPLAVWQLLFLPQPPRGHQGITALCAVCPDFRVEGDPLLAAQAMHALERLVELGRSCPEPETTSTRAVLRDAGQVTGRYVELPGINGGTERIYYETAGRGLPIVFLHTAGADGRQFHELLCDVEIAEKWRMLAFDLPMHGKSIPSLGWWREPYRLTTRDYAHWCVAFIRAVARQRAVVMGCSMGGAMAVYLAAHHREDVAAAVCLEAPDRSPGRHNLFLCHARVNQAAHNPTYVYNLMSPFSPLEARRRAWWYYSQGGFGVYAGDLHFYSSEWDSSLVAGKIDVSDCPVVLLTGEYDYSASPESTRRLAEQIPGARLEIMAKLGHFPMAEDPDRFRAHLVPVLEALAKKLGGSESRGRP
jgi:pimeloyl-ACP methyl ester carboxylesterase